MSVHCKCGAPLVYNLTLPWTDNFLFYAKSGEHYLHFACDTQKGICTRPWVKWEVFSPTCKAVLLADDEEKARQDVEVLNQSRQAMGLTPDFQVRAIDALVVT